jgi:hypothetical protein
MTPPLVMCSWCGEEPSQGKHQGSECCHECRAMGAAYRVRVSLQRWKRSAEKKETA